MVKNHRILERLDPDPMPDRLGWICVISVLMKLGITWKTENAYCAQPRGKCVCELPENRGILQVANNPFRSHMHRNNKSQRSANIEKEPQSQSIVIRQKLAGTCNQKLIPSRHPQLAQR
jgi:hypothetical protein